MDSPGHSSRKVAGFCPIQRPKQESTQCQLQEQQDNRPPPNRDQQEIEHDPFADLFQYDHDLYPEFPIDSNLTSGSTLGSQPNIPIQPRSTDSLELPQVQDIVFENINQTTLKGSKANSNLFGEEDLEGREKHFNKPPNMEGKQPRRSRSSIQTEKTSLSRKEKRALVPGEVASDGISSKGKVQTLPDGSLQWDNKGVWTPAVYHDELRPGLIQRMDGYGTYDKSRSRGHDQWDVTSYHVDQKTWGPSRIYDWPHMPGKLLFRLECKDYPVPEYQPEVWFDEGRVVLDGDNNPIKKWTNIPLTLASNADAWLMENIRREDTRITHKDFRARMPRRVHTKNGSSKPLGGLSALGMRMTRFRMSAACPAWNEREGSDAMRAYVKGLLSAESLAANSTEELSGLTLWQQAECRKPNKGLYPERAGDRALSQEERKRRNETEAARLAELNPQLEDVEAVEYDQQRLFTDDRPPPAQILSAQPNAHVNKHKRSHAVTSCSDDGQLDPSPKRRNVNGISSPKHTLPRLPRAGHANVPSTVYQQPFHATRLAPSTDSGDSGLVNEVFFQPCVKVSQTAPPGVSAAVPTQSPSQLGYPVANPILKEATHIGQASKISSRFLPLKRSKLEISQPERKRKRSDAISDSESKDLPASKR